MVGAKNRCQHPADFRNSLIKSNKSLHLPSGEIRKFFEFARVRRFETRWRTHHASWLRWLQAEFGWSDETVRKFMRVYDSLNPNNVGIGVNWGICPLRTRRPEKRRTGSRRGAIPQIARDLPSLSEKVHVYRIRQSRHGPRHRLRGADLQHLEAAGKDNGRSERRASARRRGRRHGSHVSGLRCYPFSSLCPAPASPAVHLDRHRWCLAHDW